MWRRARRVYRRPTSLAPGELQWGAADTWPSGAVPAACHDAGLLSAKPCRATLSTPAACMTTRPNLAGPNAAQGSCPATNQDPTSRIPTNHCWVKGWKRPRAQLQKSIKCTAKIRVKTSKASSHLSALPHAAGHTALDTKWHRGHGHPGCCWQYTCSQSTVGKPGLTSALLSPSLTKQPSTLKGNSENKSFQMETVSTYVIVLSFNKPDRIVYICGSWVLYKALCFLLIEICSLRTFIKLCYIIFNVAQFRNFANWKWQLMYNLFLRKETSKKKVEWSTKTIFQLKTY